MAKRIAKTFDQCRPCQRAGHLLCRNNTHGV
jgi:hypothetical protein